jgi:hypothetical protein
MVRDAAADYGLRQPSHPPAVVGFAFVFLRKSLRGLIERDGLSVTFDHYRLRILIAEGG